MFVHVFMTSFFFLDVTLRIRLLLILREVKRLLTGKRRFGRDERGVYLRVGRVTARVNARRPLRVVRYCGIFGLVGVGHGAGLRDFRAGGPYL